MIALSLSGAWQMKKTSDTRWLAARVPGSVYADLLNAGKMEDPFFGENEEEARDISRHDFEYRRSFTVPESLLACDKVILRCEGLDTLAEIAMNGHTVGETGNMHRAYEFEIRSCLCPGENGIHITFHSPMAYIAAKQAQFPLWGSKETVDGFPHLRKAHYMLGWDWAPQLPDMGIWRGISIVGYSAVRLADVHVTQSHAGGAVALAVEIAVEAFGVAAELAAVVTLTAPEGQTTLCPCAVKDGRASGQIRLTHPQLWWPNGYGAQPLYEVSVRLEHAAGSGTVLDQRALRIGLRSVQVVRKKDRWGESFAFCVNGLSIFAMGADYIPEDSILARLSPERTERLVRDCASAHFNMLRVWGGGIYPPDEFYDLCDRYGILVWQDFLYACAAYALTPAFEANVTAEAADNVRRIRHHACLALWCGNNEMEWAWAGWKAIKKDPGLKADYLRLFEEILPRVVSQFDPQTCYWPSSPSSGGNLDRPDDLRRGDTHYWNVWSPANPVTLSRTVVPRFVSEFGFQSFPEPATARAFARPEEMTPFSAVMEKHQKNLDHNRWIVSQLADWYPYARDYETLAYASQLLQADAIRLGVEHWRAHRGRCMGVLYWQLNDCWPCVSWSSIDYFGRYKALQYAARRFFAPVLLVAREEGQSVTFFVANETPEKVSGRIAWKLRDNASRLLAEGESAFAVPALSARRVSAQDFTGLLPDARSTYLEYACVTQEGRELSGGTLLFVKPKHFHFLDPKFEITVAQEEDRFVLTVASRAYARGVRLGIENCDCVFSENFFDLCAGAAKRVFLNKADMSVSLGRDEVEKRLTVMSVMDIGKERH